MLRARKRQAAAIVIVATLNKKERQKRKWWVRPWISRRSALGAYSTLLQELQVEDPQQFKSFLRMTANDLEEILKLVGPRISKKDTNMRQAIPATERLAVTLRFLATGMLSMFF